MKDHELETIAKEVMATNTNICNAAKQEGITLNHLAVLLSGTNMLLLSILLEVNKHGQATD